MILFRQIPSELIKLNALTLPPHKRIVNANVDTVIGNT
jgi:hypothetical protein